VTPMLDLSVAANPRAALAALRGIIVLRRFPVADRTVRAAEFRPRMARLLTMPASARLRPGAARDHRSVSLGGR
jgi:hypothetical protein